jgi:putative chitinase
MNILAALRATLPRAPQSWLVELARVLPGTTIDTPAEIASFVAQLAHESDQFSRLEENLNYSADRLMQVWPRRFPDLITAQKYDRDPVRLANQVYGARLGNRDPGDGWRYRGRGPIQITGRRNYERFEAATQLPALGVPEILLQPYAGIRSAVWYWEFARLDQDDDDNDVRAETRKINGGEHGLRQRQQYFDAMMRALSGIL